jgi:CxxC motif-containing protein (DUF1111 family)
VKKLTKTSVAQLFLATLVVALPALAEQWQSRPGGTGTVSDTTIHAFGRPFNGLGQDLKRKFAVGSSFFREVWVQAPASTEARDGLGPTFHATSCAGCHVLDGRGIGYDWEGKVDRSLLFRLSLVDERGVAIPHPSYGDQLQPLSISGVPAEGQMAVEWEYRKGRYADGTSYELRRPLFSAKNLSMGPFENEMRISPRVTPHMIGLGLLEAIPEQEILARADPMDADGDGVSGRPNFVKDLSTGALRLGRFGWKANQPSLFQQNAAAFLGDLGLTTQLFPQENCPEAQGACAASASGGKPEVDPLVLDRVTTYTQLLAVPARRMEAGREILDRGERVFHRIGCASCHHPNYTTGPHQLEILKGQSIAPYTDLLLHDMGEELADHRPDGEADGREWRTPPLWGIGLIPVVNRHQNLLHDGRARSVEEAILWHGGEGRPSAEGFLQLPAEDRAAILAFVNSL